MTITTAQTTDVDAIHRAYLAAPKDCYGRARIVDLRELSGLAWHVFDATVKALHREFLVGATWSTRETTLAEDNASVLIDGTSRHLLVWGRFTERPAHNPAGCQGHPEARVTSNR